MGSLGRDAAAERRLDARQRLVVGVVSGALLGAIASWLGYALLAVGVALVPIALVGWRMEPAAPGIAGGFGVGVVSLLLFRVGTCGTGCVPPDLTLYWAIGAGCLLAGIVGSLLVLRRT